MKTIFTTTQFLIILAVNLIFLMLVGAHYFSETVRTVKDTQTVTNTVYKDRVVQKCDATENMMTLMQKASNICKDTGTRSLAGFQIDNTGKPVFKCE